MKTINTYRICYPIKNIKIYSQSLFLNFILLAILGLICSKSATAQTNYLSLVSSTYAESKIPGMTGFSPFENYEIAFHATSGPDYIGTAFDGPDAGIIVTDGTNFDYFPFTSASFLIGAPTTFSKPDIIFLDDATKAVVVCNTNDANFGAFIMTFDIAYTSTSITITQSTSNLGEPVNSAVVMHDPRIDNDPGFLRYAVVAVDPNDDVLYSIYESTGSYTASVYNQTAGVTPTGTVIRFHPDIALSHDLSTGDYIICVCYLEESSSASSYTALQIDQTNSSGPTINAYAINIANSLISIGNLGWPKIAGENSLSGVSSTTMDWGVAISLVNVATYEHLIYANSVSGSITQITIDAPYNTSNPMFRNYEPALDWMNSGSGAPDAFLSWMAAASNGVSIAYNAVGVMNPIGNNTATTPPYFYNTWYQVDNTGTPDFGTRTSVCSYGLGPYKYATAYSASNIDIYYKIQTMGNYSFRNINPMVTNKEKIILYPNPSSDVLNIIAEEETDYSIVDIYGRTLIKNIIKKGKTMVDISSLAKGVYLLKTSSDTMPVTIQ